MAETFQVTLTNEQAAVLYSALHGQAQLFGEIVKSEGEGWATETLAQTRELERLIGEAQEGANGR